MKKNVLLTAFFAVFSLVIFADSPKREFRATWVTTHYSIDWPKAKATSEEGIRKQQAELISIMDKLVKSNMNAFTFQVRPVADAFYKSSYEPWSGQLTGTRGKDPGYDPLAFAVEEAHKRGLELHAWVNPYRYEVNAGEWGDEDPLRVHHSEWLLTYNNGTFNGTILDPGLPEARAYTVAVIREIVENYDIDGVIFDDYFYPYGGTKTEDAASMDKYKLVNQSVADWRRENVDKLIKDVYAMIQETKPWVRFGMAPAGIWTMDASAALKYGISLPAGIWGMDAYTTLYCNTLEWMKAGTVDYIAPQIYWSTTASGQDFDVLSQWWSMMASHFSSRLPNGQKVHYFSSNNAYSDWVTPHEMGLEVDANRRYDQLGGTGAIFYNTYVFLDKGVHEYLCDNQYGARSLMPVMSWKKAAPLSAPSGLMMDGDTLRWMHEDAPRFTVYAFPKGSNVAQALSDPANLLGVTNQNEWLVRNILNVNNTTFAVCAYDRYGNEYAAALFNEGEAERPEDKPLPAGTVAIEKVWEHLVVDSDWPFGVGNNHRSMTYHAGNLYIPNVGSESGEIFVLDAATGKRTGLISTGETGFYLHNVRMTEDGHLLFGNTGSGTSRLFVSSTSLTAGGEVEEGRISIGGRSDFFYPYGSWNKEGFLLAMSNTGNVLKVPFEEGILLPEKQYSNASLPQGTAAKVIPAADGMTFYASASKAIPTRHMLEKGELLESFGADKPVVTEVSGLAVFAMSGHDYMVTPADNTGSFEVFDISRGLPLATKTVEATSTLGSQPNETFTVDFAVSVVDSCNAHIYVLAPNNGLAAYKMTFIPDGTGVEDVELSGVNLIPTYDGLRAELAGTQCVEIYHVNGVRMVVAVATNSYSCTLPQGVYLVRVGNTVQKFVR